MGRMRISWAVLGACVIAVMGVREAHAGDLKWEERRFRIELSGFAGIHQGSRDRSGDWNLNGFAEYEAPVWKRSTLSLRLQPLFYYDQDTTDDRRFFRNHRWFDDDREYNDGSIWGVGIGPALRVYSKAETRKGWFAEAGVIALLHEGRLDGNSSNFNFSTELGVGYMFENDWHVALKWRHISNGSIGDENAGANGVGVGVGYSF